MTKDEVKAKAQMVADKYFRSGHKTPAEDKIELIGLIEYFFSDASLCPKEVTPGGRKCVKPIGHDGGCVGC